MAAASSASALCDLQLEVLRIEPRDDVAGVDAIADIDDPGDDLAGDAEAEIGLVARAHDADEFALGVRVLEGDPLHLHRTLDLMGAGAVLASQAASRRSAARAATGLAATWRCSFDRGL